MPNFGLSAYLKLICLSDRRQQSALRERLQPSEGGYDYHKSLKLAAERLLVRGLTEAEVLTSLDGVKQAPERQSAKEGIKVLADWRRGHPGEIVDFSTVTAEGPAGIVRVSFQPTFGIKIRNQLVAVHVWNNKAPDLVDRFVYGALSLFPSVYSRAAQVPDDVAVLSLRDGAFFRLSEGMEYSSLGAAQIAVIERRLQEIATGLGLPRAERRAPSSPPPRP